MNTLRKSLLAITAVFSLAPTAVFAYPPQCDEVCFSETAQCGTICYFGVYERTTCAEAGYCFEARPKPAEPTASVTEGASRQAEDSAPVCKDAQPAEARTASAKS